MNKDERESYFLRNMFERKFKKEGESGKGKGKNGELKLFFCRLALICSTLIAIID